MDDPNLPVIPVDAFPDINPAGQGDPINFITAVGVLEGAFDRLYAGYYDGTIFTTANATDPTPTWTRIDENGAGLPDRPITAIAVHPGSTSRVFVALSGFAAHSIYVSPDGGATWQAYDASTDPNDELATRPVNALAIVPVTHELLAGTDDGVYRRATADLDGELWAKSATMPNVAVYDFAVKTLPTQEHEVFAATHGRGVWRLSDDPQRASAQGFRKTSASGAFGESTAFFAQSLDPLRPCDMTLVATDGSICATAGTDADDAALTTNGWGHLVATKAGAYEERPMAWACLDGACAGGVAASACPLREVRIACGASSASWLVPAVEELEDPASAALVFGPAFSGGATTGTFAVRPTMLRADGSVEVLCAESVPFSASQSIRDVLDTAVAAINASSSCTAAGVTAFAVGSDDGEGETPAPIPHRLLLSAPSRWGIELIPAIDGALHAYLGLESVGLSVRKPVSPRLALTGSTLGGTITLMERTAIGRCRISVPTRRGESIATVLGNLRNALSTPSAGTPACIQDQNPRDAIVGGDGKLRAVASGALTIHNTDPGLSFTLDGDG